MQIRKEVLKLMSLITAIVIIMAGCVPHSPLERIATATLVPEPSKPIESATVMSTVTPSATETSTSTAAPTKKATEAPTATVNPEDVGVTPDEEIQKNIDSFFAGTLNYQGENNMYMWVGDGGKPVDIDRSAWVTFDVNDVHTVSNTLKGSLCRYC